MNRRPAGLYEVYCAAVGGKAFNGDSLPKWAQFRHDPAKQLQREAWLAVAQAAQEPPQAPSAAPGEPTRFRVGDRVQLIGHTHAGKRGKVIRLEKSSRLADAGVRPRVELEDGYEVLLASDSQAKLLEPKAAAEEPKAETETPPEARKRPAAAGKPK